VLSGVGGKRHLKASDQRQDGYTKLGVGEKTLPMLERKKMRGILGRERENSNPNAYKRSENT